MNAEELALRLLQSVQGCTIHLHGPVQAWLSVVNAEKEGSVKVDEVLEIVLKNSDRRIKQLVSEGASTSDVRIRKEQVSLAFIKKLLE